jgi:dynein intermediate chain
LNADTEEPFVSTQVGSGKALNKIAWDKEGRKTAIGSSDGHVYVYDIGEVSKRKFNIKQYKVCTFTNL